MEESIKELKKLAELLKIEKKADFDEYKQLIQSLPLAERKEKGACWHPLNVLKTGFSFGERAFITVERTSKLDQPHQFREGMPVNLFTVNEAYKGEQTGVIHFLDKNRMKIILNHKDIPDWVSLGQLGVDLLFDERTYTEMEKALQTVMAAERNRLAELREILLGKKPATFEEIRHKIALPTLNHSQNEAINDLLAARDVAVIHGPPGTGKTTTLVQAIKILSQFENCILVTAPSNAAVDLMAERLSAQNLPVVRIGNISRVDEKLLDLTLEGQLAKHPELKNIKKVKVKAAECRREAARFKRNFGQEERVERKRLYEEASELDAWANTLENRIIDEILSNAKVICCTLVNATHSVLKQMKFHTVVIDEAAQALEPATWIPIIRASKVILAGDPFQLPPTVKSKQAQREGFNITLLEKIIARQPQVNLLNVQYRMNQIIMGFSNKIFYNNALTADISVENWKLDIENDAPFVFIDTAGCGFEEQSNSKTKSRYNPDEFSILREHLYQLLPHWTHEIPSIGIISPYKEQVTYIKKAFAEDAQLLPISEAVTIDTIDAFQGQERDIIYLSLVRSNDKADIGFLNDHRRMNVAMTRARKKLVIIGDSATIGSHRFYEDFLTYADEKGIYQSAYEYMYQ